MKKVKALTLVAIFAGSMMFPSDLSAKNRINSDGCLEIYEEHSALWGLITWETVTHTFCNEDGSPIQFEDVISHV